MKYLENLPPKEFAENAVHFLAELNAIHAFREGNGRTQLSFFALLAIGPTRLIWKSSIPTPCSTP
jgi:fido (protein-threonine AMPylation protein)